MKLNIITKVGSVLIALFTISSCDSFIDDNIDPNLTKVNPPQVILPSIEAQLGFTMGSDLLRYSAIWSQQIAAQNGRQTENYDKYVLSSTEVNAVWRFNLYGGILADVEEILKKPVTEVHPHYFGIAKTIKAFTYSILVDFWGDIPFSEAMQGQANLQPAIDDDATIYPKLITLLDEAIVNLNTTSATLTTVGTDDYFYGGSGNISRWIKFANTLKLRLYLHMANVPGFDTGVITTFINNTPVTQFMESINDDFQLRFETTSGRQNPFHQFILTRTDDICTSSTIINLMNSKADPRRSRYFTPAPFSQSLYATPPTGTTGYIGLQNGFGAGSVNNTLSRVHTFVRGAVTSTTIPAGPTLPVSSTTGLAYNGSAPQNMLTFAEYNFIRAELALRYGAPGSAEAFYQAGITASMLDAGLTAVQATAYLGSDVDGDLATVGTLSGTPEQQLQKLIEEKYVANFAVAGESWSDWRRTGYPILQLLPGTLNPGNNGKVPRVLLYPQQEVDANPKLAAIARTDLSDKRVFWDVRVTGQE
jgi:Starch-binding associating with outer membrane